MNKLGFGFLRLPYLNGQPDYDLINQMVDAYMEAGGTYFDTAYTYLGGDSEKAVRKCVAERKERESFLLCDKLPGYMAVSQKDCYRYFEEQLRRCGVDYFDVFMLHWLNGNNYGTAERFDEFGFLSELKEKGKAKRIGFSFHDSPELLDEILTVHPEIDCVLLQINYLDWESPSIQSRKCYETAVAHGVSVMIMEPVKGGKLAAVPKEAEAILNSADPEASPAELAIRFAQSLPGVERVLSGMNTLEQIRENVKIPIEMDDDQKQLLMNAASVLRAKTAVDCTGCGYCLSHCPKSIEIPKIFAVYNDIVRYPDDNWKIQPAYMQMTKGRANASDCIACGSCSAFCPQKLPIPELMRKASRALDG